VTQKVNYIIAAQDATKDAIRSIQDNFRTLDRTVKTTAQGISVGLSFIAGAALKGMFRASLDATAEATGKNSDFTKSLDDMRQSARNLMVPKDGLSGVTENLKELSKTLKDPAVVSAADALFSTMIKGATGYLNVLAKGAAGWRIILTGSGGNESVDLDNRIKDLEGRAKFFQADQSDSGRKKYRELIREAQQLRRDYEQSLKGSSGEGLQAVDATAANDLLNSYLDSQVAKLDAAAQAAKDYQDAVNELNKALPSIADDIGKFADDQIKQEVSNFEQLQKSAQDSAEFFNALYQDSVERRRREVADYQKAAEQMTEFARQAARNMQDAFAQFLFDPFHGGLKGMLRGFIDTIRKMLAEAAAAKIFDLLGNIGKNSGSSTGGKVLSAIGSFFGGYKAEGGPLEQGKWYIAGERGPEPVWGGGAGAFATGYGKGGVTVNVNQNIDARGADIGLTKALPGILKKNNADVTADIIQGIRRGKYAV